MQKWVEPEKTPAKPFDEWWRVYNSLYGCPPAVVAAEAAWNAAVQYMHREAGKE
jgi:hypothetical protein